jgi:hypothetical protein
VEAAKAARRQAMGADVLWYRYLIEVDGARPPGLRLSSLILTLSNTSSVAGAPADPLSSPGIGTVSMTGSALQYQQVATWLEAVNKIDGLSSASLTNATRTGQTVTFGSGAVINTDALSRRYLKAGG